MNQTEVENDDSTIVILLKHPCLRWPSSDSGERLAAVIEKLHKAAGAVYASSKRKSLFQSAEKTYGNFLVEDEGVN